MKISSFFRRDDVEDKNQVKLNPHEFFQECEYGVYMTAFPVKENFPQVAPAIVADGFNFLNVPDQPHTQKSLFLGLMMIKNQLDVLCANKNLFDKDFNRALDELQKVYWGTTIG